MINWYDQKHLGEKPRTTLVSTGSWYKETSKKAREKKRDHKKLQWSLINIS